MGETPARRVRRRLALPEAVFLAFAVVFVFSVAVTVAMMDGGPPALAVPFERVRIEYIGDVPLATELGPARFVREYPLLGRRITHHSGTHPPGGVLFLYWVSQLFGTGAMPAALVAVAVASLGVVPAYLLARELAGPRVATLTAGLYVVAPNLVLFTATSMDGVFLVLPVLTLWLFHRAIHGRAWFATLAWSVACGVALAAAMLMTFATVCLAVVFACYALLVPRRYFPPVLASLLVAAVTFAACKVGLYLTTGYDVIATLFAAIERDASVMGSGHESLRRYFDVSVANLVAFPIGTGLAVTTLWVREIATIAPRRSALPGWWTFVLAGATAIPALAFSTLFTLEVERIWLFLAPYLLIPAAVQLARSGPTRPRLAYHMMGLTFLQTWVTELLLFTYW
jgi:hypothetical protein